MTDSRTFWNGRRQADAQTLYNAIDAQQKATGKAEVAGALELYRKFGLSYYHLFNNGGGEWNRRGQGITVAARKFGYNAWSFSITTLRSRTEYDDHFYSLLEELGDKVMDAALAELNQAVAA